MMEIPYTAEELCDATVELIKKNNLKSCYIRPLAYYGYGQMGVDPTGAPVDVIIAVWPWDAYLGPEALENGIKVGVSSWRQRSFNAIPPAVKSVCGTALNVYFFVIISLPISSNVTVSSPETISN